MLKPSQTPQPLSAPLARVEHAAHGQPGRRLLVLALLLTAAFGGVLFQLVRLVFRSELHSHLLLIPVVSWFIWRFIDRPAEFSAAAKGSPVCAAMVALLGLACLAGYYRLSSALPLTEYLWAGVLAYLVLLLAGAVWLLGWQALRTHAFAWAFLVFFVPLPLAVTDLMSIGLQRGSAEVTDWCLSLTGLPVFRDALAFRLPGLTITIAEECSGVRSTLVLFIFCLLAGKLFLRSGWKRAVLAALALPLGLLRNALRITVLSWLTVEVNPKVIHGPLHHQGGPIFFALSLIPMFVLLWYFKRSESAKSPEDKKSL